MKKCILLFLLFLTFSNKASNIDKVKQYLDDRPMMQLAGVATLTYLLNKLIIELDKSYPDNQIAEIGKFFFVHPTKTYLLSGILKVLVAYKLQKQKNDLDKDDEYRLRVKDTYRIGSYQFLLGSLLTYLCYKEI